VSKKEVDLWGTAGPYSGGFIAQYVLATSLGMNVSALSNTIHIYPTLAQINHRVKAANETSINTNE
tara:strand:- start:85950 stop:86147 length:198 start_codon:yes stop_codon:yes gene_type:complete